MQLIKALVTWGVTAPPPLKEISTKDFVKRKMRSEAQIFYLDGKKSG
jgi:hypothetical protein